MDKVIKDTKGDDYSWHRYKLIIDGHLAETFAQKKEIKGACIDIMRRRGLQNSAKKLGIEPVIRRGEWNGYGCPISGRMITPMQFSRIIKDNDKKPVRIPLTEEEKEENWAKRLAKLAEISIEEARTIAEEKIDYKQEKIDEIDGRQAEHYSSRRQSLLNKMQRANPLRRITDGEHAQAILAASNRHNNTDYDYLLDEGREKAKFGEIDRSEVREYARQAMA